MDLRSQDWGPPHLHLHLNPSPAQAQGCPRRKKDSTSKKTHPLNPRRQKNSSRKKTKDLVDLAQWTWTRRRKRTWTEEEELLALDQDLGTTQLLPLARGLPNPMLPHPSPSLLTLSSTRRKKNSTKKINSHTNLLVSSWLQSLVRTHNVIMPLTNSHTHTQTHRHIH